MPNIAHHPTDLTHRNTTGNGLLTGTLRRGNSLSPMLSLARELSRAIPPISPRTTFRQALREGLRSTALQQQARNALKLTPPASNAKLSLIESLPSGIEDLRDIAPRHWIWGVAAVGSAVSLASVLAYAISHRERPADRPAA